MSDIADFFSISNSIDISTLQRQQQVQMRLAEFRERADALARQTGVTPLGFFAFEKASPTPLETNRWGKWGGALLGGTAGLFIGIATGGIGAAPLVIGGTAVGFGIGAFAKESETSRVERALSRYDAYLTQTEVTAISQQRAPLMSQAPLGPVRQTGHAQSVLADRAQQSEVAPGI